jgi:LysR family transcriptional activator of mexEF-oprN operon
MNNDITSPEFSFDETVLRRIDLNLLVVFAMVMRHGSVQHAAGRLYLGSSGVSMALNRLRSITGDKLFVRGRHSLEPTAFARTLFDRVSPALCAIGSALNPVGFDPKTANGSLRIAMSQDAEMLLGPRLQQALASQAPGIKLILRQGDYRRVSNLLDDDVADMVLTAQPWPLEQRYRSEVLHTESFVVVCGKNTKGQLSLSDYLLRTHVLVSAKGDTRGRLDELLAEHGYSRTVGVVTESFAALPYLLHANNLIANVPRLAAKAMASSFHLAIHELPLPSPTFPIALTWRARDDDSAALSWMRDLVRREFQAVVAKSK